ncbi:MAG: sugar ABC transporter permease [Pseudomonadota bacterium]
MTALSPTGTAENTLSNRIELGQKRAAWALGAPALLGLGLFLFIPMLLALGLTFTDQRLLSPNETEFVGVRNYVRLLSITMITQDPSRDERGELIRDQDGNRAFERVRGVIRPHPKYAGYRPLVSVRVFGKRMTILARDPTFIRALVNTFLFVLMVVPIQTAAALGMALLVNRQIKGRNLFRTVYFAPVVVSMVVVSILWVMLYNRDIGLVNRALSFLTQGLAPPTDWLGNATTALPAIAVMSAWQGAGFQMVIFLAGLQGINATLYEAADIDGADAWQKFRYVTLPGLKNTTVFVLISTTIAAFGLFNQVDVMTSGGPNDATATVMFHAITKGVREQDIAYGSTISIIYFLMITAIALGQKRLFGAADS